MNQALHFVPARLLAAALLVAAAAVLSPASAGVEILLASAQDEKLDPIITGANTVEEKLEAWKARKARFEECGLCGQEQPFPADLPKQVR